MGFPPAAVRYAGAGEHAGRVGHFAMVPLADALLVEACSAIKHVARVRGLARDPPRDVRVEAPSCLGTGLWISLVVRTEQVTQIRQFRHVPVRDVAVLY